jgi:hypothetical protein
MSHYFFGKFAKNAAKKSTFETLGVTFLILLLRACVHFSFEYIFSLTLSWLIAGIWIRLMLDEFDNRKNFAWTFAIFNTLSLILSFIISWEAIYDPWFPLIVICNGILITYATMNIMLLYDRENVIIHWFQQERFL